MSEELKNQNNINQAGEYEAKMSDTPDFNVDTAKQARIDVYKKLHPDAVEDVEKARAMAEAGDEYRTLAANARKEAHAHEKTADWYAARGRAQRRGAEALEAEAQHNMDRGELHRQWAAEDLANAHESRTLARDFIDKAINNRRTARARRKFAENNDLMADMDEYDAARNYDFTNPQNNLPEYMRPENKGEYDKALAEVDPDVLKKVNDAVFTIFSIVGDSSEYRSLINKINQDVFDGHYKQAHLTQGYGDNEMIVGVEQ